MISFVNYLKVTLKRVYNRIIENAYKKKGIE